MLKELWTEEETLNVSNAYKYVLELRVRVEGICKLSEIVCLILRAYTKK